MNTTKKLDDLIVNGIGSSNGGLFDRVEINGKGKIYGDVKCHSFVCNGTGSITGNLTAKTAKVSGNSKLNGVVTCEKLQVQGRASLKNKATINKFKVEGKASVDGSLKSEEIQIKGKATIQGDCEAELFKSEGIFQIDGLLNADQIIVTLYGECSVKEIGAQTVRIKKKSGLLNLFKSIFPNSLVTNLIEGDEIEIANTTATVIRGHNVNIGPGCRVDLVEYSGEYSCDKNSVVSELKKV